MKKFLLIALMAGVFYSTPIFAQVMSPNDPVVNYDASNPPSRPPWGQVGKWVRTPRISWDTDAYKCYIYKDLAFRVLFPKNFDVSGSIKYPAIVMLHGAGEKGYIYDNEYHLLHGGQQHRNAVNNNIWKGFVIYPQTDGAWDETDQDQIKEFLEYMVQHVNLDINKVNLHGLSMGGGGTWKFALRHPKLFASILPMSAAYPEGANTNPLLYKPIWQFQGGLDTNPKQGVSEAKIDAILDNGANAKLTVYPNLGHGVWNTAYAEQDFFPYMERANVVNPWVLFGRSEFCPDDNINVVIGVTPGFDGYEWRRDGTLINGATANTIQVNSLGSYTCRVRRGSEWSYWSPVPMEIKHKAPTVTPPIQLVQGYSPVLPAPDEKGTVILELPDGYESYEWRVEGFSTVISTEKFCSVTQPGNYVARVSEFFGCSSSFSEPFKVVAADSPQKPDAPVNVIAATVSKTEIEISWNQNPNPVYNETGFEIYRKDKANDSYELIHTTEADVLEYLDANLVSNTRYYYLVRAINNQGASHSSNEANALTEDDLNPPTAPFNLKIVSSSSKEIVLEWEESSDDVGIKRYEIYKGPYKAVVTTSTKATVYNLIEDEVYNFKVVAVDYAGNKSSFSNQVTVVAALNGLSYKYYEGSWDNLPDFNNLTPVKEGRCDNFDISYRNRDDNFAFLFQGYINIPVSGNYTFETYSDDGSKLYIGEYAHSATALVNNDGLHGNQYRAGTINLPAGVHPITVTYFEKGGGQNLSVFWKNTAHGVVNRQQIPNDAFKSNFTMPGNAPNKPSDIIATATSYNQIQLSWTDNSDNETGYEVYRSISNAGPFVPVHTTKANVTYYTDSLLDASTTYYYKVQAIGKYGESGFVENNKGLSYSYYTTGTLSSLPNFASLTPSKEGTIDNFDIGVKLRNDNFAIKFSGKIIINSEGQYTFYTRSDDGSKLYIGDFNESNLVVNNNYVQGPTERSGTKYLTPGIYQIHVTFFERTGGETLEVRYSGPGIDKQLIPDGVLGEAEVNATTLALPPAPDVPVDFAVSETDHTSVSLQWEDVEAEEGYIIFRSVGGDENFKVLKKLNANQTSFTDQDLFPNVNYYYKAAAYNAGGESVSQVLHVKTLNHTPVLSGLQDIVVRFEAQEIINLFAEDEDFEILSFTGTNLPSFASILSYGDGTGVLQIEASEDDQGIYDNVIISVLDQNGGVDSDTVRIIVNDNYAPELSILPILEVNEGDSVRVLLTVTDQNLNDSLFWDFKELPEFINVSFNNNRECVLDIVPGFADSYNYNIKVGVSDANYGYDEQTLQINVLDVNPNMAVYVNFTETTNANTPWNNVKSLNTTGLLDENGTVSGVGLSFQTTWWRTFVDGTVTGNNSGIYPDNVIREYYYFGIFGGPNSVNVNVTGLDNSKKYKFTFFASSKWANVPDNGETIFSINGESDTLRVQNNTNNVAQLSNIVPGTNGVVTFGMSKGINTPVGYINALVIESVFDEAPAAPNFLSAENVSGGVKIRWNDAPFNENGFEVFRSTDSLSYEIIGIVSQNIEEFTDQSIVSNQQYFYKIRSFNEYGYSEYSKIIKFKTLSALPYISEIPNVVVETGDLIEVDIALTNSPDETVNFAGVVLPSFVTLQDLGNGFAKLIIAPEKQDVGLYPDQIISVSSVNGSTEKSFSIEVKAKKLTSVYLNFSSTFNAGLPWNNTAKTPQVNDVFSNLKNDQGQSTNIAVKLLTSFGGVMNQGGNTGNNSGVVPDNVLREFYWFGIYNASNSVRMEVSGLNPGQIYGFKFIGSSKFAGSGITDNGETNYTINGETAAVAVQNNTNNYGEILNIVPDVHGKVFITITKGSGAQVGYINALIIDAYENPNELEETESVTLIAESLSKTSIGLKWIDELDETSYEVYRSSEKDGSYNLIASLPANSHSYTDNNLQQGTRYYYKLKTLYSGSTKFSNIATSATLMYSVYSNLNGTSLYDAPTPWNNFGILPSDGDIFAGFKNEFGEETGIWLRFEKSLTGSNDWGMTTGNNTGIYPDKVLKSFFFMESTETAEVYVAGLDQSMKYNFVFFNSIDIGFSVTTNFSIGSAVVVPEGQNNINSVAKIINVTPDENNEVKIDVSSSSNWSIWNALVIEAYPSEEPSAARRTPIDLPSDHKLVKFGSELTGIKIYPNPFRDKMIINVDQENPIRRISIVDLSGHTVYFKAINESFGRQGLVELNLGDKLKSGFYLLQVIFEGSNTKTYKIIKE